MRTLRTSVLVFSVLMTGACAGLPVPVPTGGTSTGTTTTGSVATDIVKYTNDARTRNGLPPLSASSKLMQAASIHAKQMAQYQRDAHTISGAQYPTLASRLQAVGYDYSSAAENIAWNQRDAQSAVNGWMNSSGHRANILNPKLKEIGAAMARSAKGEPYWIQVFASPL